MSRGFVLAMSIALSRVLNIPAVAPGRGGHGLGVTDLGLVTHSASAVSVVSALAAM